MRPDVSVEIVKAMGARKKKSMRMGEIARVANVSIPAAKYAVDRLVRQGILIPETKHDLLWYRLQDLFYVGGITSKIEALAGELSQYVDLSHKKPEERGNAMLENLRMLLGIVVLKTEPNSR